MKRTRTPTATGAVILARLNAMQRSQAWLANQVGVDGSAVTHWIYRSSGVASKRLRAVAVALDMTAMICGTAMGLGPANWRLRKNATRRIRARRSRSWPVSSATGLQSGDETAAGTSTTCKQGARGNRPGTRWTTWDHPREPPSPWSSPPLCNPVPPSRWRGTSRPAHLLPSP